MIWRPRPSFSFMEATKGVAMPLRLTSPAPCTNCHGSGARPGTSPKVCPNCNGRASSTATRVRSASPNRAPSAGAAARSSSNPATSAKAPASRPVPARSMCGSRRASRTVNVFGSAGQGEAGLRGAPSGDLYVTVHVRPDKVFGRDGDDLTVTVPVSFGELALGTTLSVPTLEGKVGVRVPKGTSDGRILRVRGRGVPKRSGGHGDLLVTVKVAVPPETRRRGGRSPGGLREGRTGQRVRPAGRVGRRVMAGRRSEDRESARTFLISVAAELAGMHAQTLRTYDRLGLVSPRAQLRRRTALLAARRRPAPRGAAAVAARGCQSGRHQADHRADQPGRGVAVPDDRDGRGAGRLRGAAVAGRRARHSWSGSLGPLGGDVGPSRRSLH